MTLKFASWFIPFIVAGAVAYADSPCRDCLKSAQEDLRRCLDNAISQEDKLSCDEKHEDQARTCEEHECTVEREQSSTKKKQSE